MKPIDPRKYRDIKIKGSDKVYYNKYPYKVRLKQNSINYDFETSASIVRYVSDDFHSKNMKMVFNYTRHVYFKTLDAFQEFMYIFAEEVNLIMAPVNKKHCDALIKVKSTNKWALEQWEIRTTKYFGKYDTKIVWDWPNTADIYGASNVSVSPLSPQMVPPGKSMWYKYFEDLGDNVSHIADSKTNTRLTYLNEKDIEDVQFFIKLQKGNVISNIIRVIVIENM